MGVLFCFLFFSFLLYFSCPSERCIADAEVASLVQASILKKNESSSTNCAFGVKRHYAASHPFLVLILSLKKPL